MAPNNAKPSVETPTSSAPAPDNSSADRRRAERKSLNKAITLVVESDREQIAHSAYGIDFSPLGVRIRSGIDLLPGQLVTVIPREGAKQAVPSRVVWVGEEGSQRVGEAGIAFLEPLSLEA